MAVVSRVRVLLVEDFEPFRRWVCLMLRNRPEVQVIAEASDGMEAVQMAGQFQPDLILIDVGLPKLSGINAARQISKLAPKAKIIFVTQESSPDVAQEAFGTGAVAYVMKICAGGDLLPAVDAALDGRQFLSSVLSGPVQNFSRG